MSRRSVALTIVLALVAGFAGRALFDMGWWNSGPVAVASASESNEYEQKWEYCAVLKAQYPGSIRGGIYWISYFKGDRPEIVDIEVGPSGNALSKALAKLGSEGWELVGEGPLEVRPFEARPGTNAPSALFLKRPKTDK